MVTEGLLAGYQHMCSPRAVCEVLGQLPRGDVEGLGLVVLRQTNRKEQIFSSTWGRIRWCVDFRGFVGTVVMVDAIDFSRPWIRFGRSVSPDWQRELERLRSYGFTVEQTRRGYVYELATSSVRYWQLARTSRTRLGTGLCRG